jgi:hypothetical protein
MLTQDTLSSSQPQPGPTEEPIRSQTEAGGPRVTASASPASAGVLLRPEVADNYGDKNFLPDRHSHIPLTRCNIKNCI